MELGRRKTSICRYCLHAEEYMKVITGLHLSLVYMQIACADSRKRSSKRGVLISEGFVNNTEIRRCKSRSSSLWQATSRIFNCGISLRTAEPWIKDRPHFLSLMSPVVSEDVKHHVYLLKTAFFWNFPLICFSENEPFAEHHSFFPDHFYLTFGVILKQLFHCANINMNILG